jgi:hypothetical protein
MEEEEVVFQSAADVLSHLQRKLSVPKSQFNKFGGYYYRNAEDILNAVKKELPEYASMIVHDEICEIGGRVYVKATATLHYMKDSISGQAYAREEESKKGMDAAQVTGATSSYARKYALNGLLCIDDVKDADHAPQVIESEVKDALSDLEKCDCLDSLKASFAANWSAWEDQKTRDRLKKAYDKRKADLSKGEIEKRKELVTAQVEMQKPIVLDDEIPDFGAE